MRMPYASEQLFLYGLTEETRSSKLDDLNSVIGYTYPQWVLDGCENGDGGPSARHSITMHWEVDDPDTFESYCTGHMRDWFSFIEERRGTETLILMLRDWFTFEDLIFYNIAYDEDGDKMLSYWNPDRGRGLKTRPARFYQNIMGRPSYLAKEFAEEWSDVILKEEAIVKQYSVVKYTRSESIAQMYMSMDDTVLSSCMSYPPSRYSTGGVHPAEAYGGDSNIDLVVIKDKDDMMFSRTLIRNNGSDSGYIRIYPANTHRVKSITKEVLKANQLPHKQVSMDGAELNLVPNPDHEHVVACPYVDGNASYVHVHTTDDGKEVLKCTSSSTLRSIDSQSDSMYEYMAFDTENLSVWRDSYDYTCDHCGDGFYEGVSGCVFPDDSDFSFCSQDCAQDGGYRFIHTGENDYMIWTDINNIHIVYYQGEGYDLDFLHVHDLCLCYDNVVHPSEDCILTTNGWYHEIDCLFVNSVDEFKRAEESNRAPVWIRPEEFEAGIGTLTEYLQDTGEQQ